MRNLSITEAKKELSHLARSEQAFRLTSRGSEVAQVRIFSRAKFDPAKAASAARRIQEMGAQVKPSRRYGAAALIQKVRDGK